MVTSVNYEHKIRMLQEIVDELNGKFDPFDLYHHKQNGGDEMFEGHYSTSGTKGEKWNITFMGIPVITGGDLDEMSEVWEDNYIRLEEKNRMKISILAESNTVCVIRDLITLFANSAASVKNKNEWLSIMKKGIENEASEEDV